MEAGTFLNYFFSFLGMDEAKDLECVLRMGRVGSFLLITEIVTVMLLIMQGSRGGLTRFEYYPGDAVLA